jgi:hypothetical protein
MAFPMALEQYKSNRQYGVLSMLSPSLHQCQTTIKKNLVSTHGIKTRELYSSMAKVAAFNGLKKLILSHLFGLKSYLLKARRTN